MQCSTVKQERVQNCAVQWHMGVARYWHKRLSKCSPWFGGHSVVKILAQWFECDDTPNPGSKKPSWSQLSDGVSCLSWWFIIFMAKNCFVSRNGKKRLFLLEWNCIVQLQKTNSPIIYFAMVECQCVLKCWGRQLYNDLAQKKCLDLVFGSFWLFCSKQIV